jgi:hypothetical protein
MLTAERLDVVPQELSATKKVVSLVRIPVVKDPPE